VAALYATVRVSCPSMTPAGHGACPGRDGSSGNLPSANLSAGIRATCLSEESGERSWWGCKNNGPRALAELKSVPAPLDGHRSCDKNSAAL